MPRAPSLKPHRLESGLGDPQPAPPPSQAPVQKAPPSAGLSAQKRACPVLLVPAPRTPAPRLRSEGLIRPAPLHPHSSGHPGAPRAAPLRASSPGAGCVCRLHVALLRCLRFWPPPQAQPVLSPSPVPDHCCCLAPCAGHSVCAAVSCCHLTTAVSLSVTRAVVCPARPHLLLSAGLERERQASGSMLPVPPSVALAARAAALGRARRHALITSVPAARQGPSARHVTGRRSQTSASQFGPKPRLSAVTARPPGPFAVARSFPPSASSSRLLGLSQRETGSRSLSPGKSEEACSVTSL